MKIQSIEIIHIAMPLLSPWTTAYGSDDVIESILVRLSDGQTSGWGETTPLRAPTYSPETARTLFVIARDFMAPLLLGQEIDSGEQLQQKLSGIKGNQFARAGFDLAWWDLYARHLQQPLWRVIGGQEAVVESGADFGVMDNIAQLLYSIEGAIEQGFKRVKLKFRPGWDFNMLSAVRQEFPDTVFHIDCNGGYSIEDLPLLRRLDEYSLAMIEQPLAHDDLIDHAKLQSQLSTPICLDESITSLHKTRKALEIGACRWVNIKPGRTGGLTPAIAINRHCAEHTVPCWMGSMLESGIGAAHCLALATLPNMAYPSDIFPWHRFYREDITTKPLEHAQYARYVVGEDSGIGREPIAEKVRECTVQHCLLNAG